MSDEAAGAAQVSPDQVSPAHHEARLRSRSRPRLNTLAVAALILGILLSPLAAVFGHIAAAQVSRSNGRERGAAIAWVSVGLGYLWLVITVVVAVALWQFLLA
jgi:cation transporter-like permease